MDHLQFTPAQLACRTGTSQLDKPVRQWLASLPSAQRIDFLKELWPLNMRYTLILLQGARLSREENRQLCRTWLRAGHHNAAQALIEGFESLLGEKTFWQMASQEQLCPAMREMLDYHGHGRLEPRHAP